MNNPWWNRVQSTRVRWQSWEHGFLPEKSSSVWHYEERHGGQRWWGTGCKVASSGESMAVAVVRELGCMCQGCSSALCPAHVAEEHFKTLAKLFGPNVPRDLPWFPFIDGQTVTKGAVVRTFEYLAGRSRKPMLDDLGRRDFGRHSVRVTGARFYAGLGIELGKLAVFARWRSDIVLHYVQDSALLKFTSECLGLMRKDSTEQIMPEDHTERAHLRSRICY